MTAYTAAPLDHPLDAVVHLPGSKSLTNRAFVTAALAEGTSHLTGILLAEDTRLMVEALRQLGIEVELDEGALVARVAGCGGQIPASEGSIFCGNAGTVMRFVAAMAATAHGLYELDGVPRMRRRPIGELATTLQALGAGVEYLGEEGCPPIRIHASGLRGGHVLFHSPESSQFVSGLLMAGPCAGQDVLVEISGCVHSVPYLRMTTAVMRAFGVEIIEQYPPLPVRFIVPAPQQYSAGTYAIEPDASNATYFLAAAAVAGGRVRVEGLGTDSRQGDVRFVEILERVGCRVDRELSALTVHGPGEGSPLRGIDVDLNDMPDTAQTLAVIALFAEGPTAIRHVSNLRVKETDRITALCRELRKLGATVDERLDGLVIHPAGEYRPAEIATYDDHRMAMSFTLATLRIPGVVVQDAHCCAKTFPDFFDRWERMLRGG
jgi:3-phosphoshikimate 1-carboxyvinyltransferase